MNNQLIPVFSGKLNNQSIKLVDARQLHEFLEVGKQFATWITERIKEYNFVENQDYIAISQKREIILRPKGSHDSL
jgi:phage anti-repressor protein